MRRAGALALGILAATGGFLDIGDIVANTTVGARYGLPVGDSFTKCVSAGKPP